MDSFYILNIFYITATFFASDKRMDLILWMCIFRFFYISYRFVTLVLIYYVSNKRERIEFYPNVINTYIAKVHLKHTSQTINFQIYV